MSELDTTESAFGVADDAARAAGVRVSEITDLDGLAAVNALFDEIWRPHPNKPLITTELLRALTKAGNYVSGAFDGEQLVGACVGFFGAPADATMHSHIAGVSATVPGRHVGFALKLHQRAWALQRGASAISWTCDPLVSRNAYFNLVKLAAVPTEYLPDFYGGMHDGINSGDESDRLLMRWELAAPAVDAACRGRLVHVDAAAERARGAVIALDRSADGRPVPGDVDAATVLVAVPLDIEALRSTDPATARLWRPAVREVLAPLMADGARITGFDRSGWYVVSAGTDSGEETLR